MDFQASQESAFFPPQRVGAGPPPAMSPSWRTWMSGVQSWQVSVTGEPQGEDVPSHQSPTGRASGAFQRSCAGCQAFPSPGAMAGEGVPALCVATRSKALLHGPEGWASCCLGPTSWGREPGKEETWIPGGMLIPRYGTPSQGTDVCAERWTPMPTPSETHIHPHDGRHYIQRQVPTIPLEAKCLHKGGEMWNRAWHTIGAQCRAAE